VRCKEVVQNRVAPKEDASQKVAGALSWQNMTSQARGLLHLQAGRLALCFDENDSKPTCRNAQIYHDPCWQRTSCATRQCWQSQYSRLALPTSATSEARSTK